MNEKPARIGNLCHRAATLLGLVLSILLFFLSGSMGTVHTVLFLVWIAFSVYSSVKVIADWVSGESRREQNFIAMLEKWTQRNGSRKNALQYFTLITALTVLIKLGVPVLLWLV